MRTSRSRKHVVVEAPHPVDVRDDFSEAVAAGLTAERKSLPCRFFYDARGAKLFEEICELEEYYPTRAEAEILRRRSPAIATLFERRPTIVELGSGSSEKTPALLAAFLERHGPPLGYHPIDVSEGQMRVVALALSDEFPGLRVRGFAGTYAEGLTAVGNPDGPRLLVWLGGSIGNDDRESAARFLASVKRPGRLDDRVLVGIDLRKDRAVLERAYDDARGVTAEFNLNLLARINRELGGHFDLGAFRHRAAYLEDEGRVEIHIESSRDQTVRIDALDLDVVFRAGEKIHTEDSTKYSFEEIEVLAERAGYGLEAQWTDAKGRFSSSVLRAR